MSDEEKTAVQIDFAQELTEPEETAEEKEKRISKEKQKRKCIVVVLIVSALIFLGFADPSSVEVLGNFRRLHFFLALMSHTT